MAKPRAKQKTNPKAQTPKAVRGPNPIKISARQEKEMRAQELKWQAEADLRTLKEAASLQNDPKRFAAAIRLGEEEAKTVASLKKNARGN